MAVGPKFTIQEPRYLLLEIHVLESAPVHYISENQQQALGKVVELRFFLMEYPNMLIMLVVLIFSLWLSLQMSSQLNSLFLRPAQP